MELGLQDFGITELTSDRVAVSGGSVRANENRIGSHDD